MTRTSNDIKMVNNTKSLKVDYHRDIRVRERCVWLLRDSHVVERLLRI